MSSSSSSESLSSEGTLFFLILEIGMSSSSSLLKSDGASFPLSSCCAVVFSLGDCGSVDFVIVVVSSFSLDFFDLIDNLNVRGLLLSFFFLWTAAGVSGAGAGAA